MSTEKQFQNFLDHHEIVHFSAKEVLFRGASDAHLKLNTDPPRALWLRILLTLRVLEALRQDLGKPIRLLSIYRSPAYNKAIGGVLYSQHTEFRACDIYSPRATPRELYEGLKKLRKAQLFIGGLGLYRGFVHVDTRKSNATWSGSGMTI